MNTCPEAAVEIRRPKVQTRNKTAGPFDSSFGLRVSLGLRISSFGFACDGTEDLKTGVACSQRAPADWESAIQQVLETFATIPSIHLLTVLRWIGSVAEP